MAGLKALVITASPVTVHGDYFLESSLSARSWPSHPHNEISRGLKYGICIKRHIAEPLIPLGRCTGNQANEWPAEEEIEAAIEEKEAENPRVQSAILNLASEEAVEGSEILQTEAHNKAGEISDEIGESVEKTAELLERKVNEFTQRAAASVTDETLKRT